MKLEEIKTTTKKPNEPFKFNNEELGFHLVDFWKWNQSDLIENRNRGILAEFIVKQALNITHPTRLEWDAFDLITTEGIKVEVKSAAYIQAWKQTDYSRVSFDIKPTKTLLEDNYSDERTRKADVYIFCLLNHKDQSTIDPMNLNQWAFYLVSAKTLNRELPHQQSIGLWSIKRIKHKKCSFADLKTCFDKIKST